MWEIIGGWVGAYVNARTEKWMGGEVNRHGWVNEWMNGWISMPHIFILCLQTEVLLNSAH